MLHNLLNVLPLLAVLMPLLPIPLYVMVKREKVHHFTALITANTFLVIILMFPALINGETLSMVFNTGLGLSISFRADMLSYFVGFTSALLWMLASIFGVEYLKKTNSPIRYDIFSLLSLSAMLGVVFTGNLFSLYIFFELLAGLSSALVFHKETPEAMSAGKKYIMFGIGGGLVLLIAIIATYVVAGTGDLSLIGFGLKGHPYTPYIFWGLIIGFGVKAGLIPFHVWLPSAHPVAPSPASALLSGVMIKAGAYGIIRTIYNVVGLETIVQNGYTIMVAGLLILALGSIFYGSALAMTQKELKKMMAYSSISQIGYIIMGVALLSPLGLVGGVLHIFNHAIIKGALFLCAGAFIHQTGFTNIEELKGIGKKMPITTLCFTFATASIIGIPPFNGFVSKWFLALGAIETVKMGYYWSGTGIIALVILIISSFMNLVYYSPIVIGAWFTGDEKSNSSKTYENKDPGLVMVSVLIILGLATLLFGVFPGIPVRLATIISDLYFK